VRAATPGWRDPRLWIGIAIVAVSVVAGARLLAAADDTVQVWAVAADMGQGDEVTATDLVAHRVRFGDAGDLDGYFRVTDELPAGARLLRGVGGGELLPRGALGASADRDTLELPISVDPQRVPPSVSSGAVVDVYLTAPGAGPDDGAPVLAGVSVVDAPSTDTGFGPTGERQLVLAVAEPEAADFFRRLGRVDDPLLTVVRRG
jgi:hypothetical protein